MLTGQGVESPSGQLLVGEEEDVELGGEKGGGGGVAGGCYGVQVVGCEEGGEEGDPAVGGEGEGVRVSGFGWWRGELGGGVVWVMCGVCIERGNVVFFQEKGVCARWKEVMGVM